MTLRLRFKLRQVSIHPLTIGLVALLIWLPLPFGSVVVWSHAAFQVAALGLAVWALVGLPRLATASQALVPTAALAAIAALGFAQASGVLSGLAPLISPEVQRLEAQASSITATGTRGSPLPHPLSLAALASRDAALSFLAIGALLLVAVVCGREREQRRALGVALVAAAGFQVLFGAKHLGRREMWGIAVSGDFSRLRGTFINPDHLALFIALVLPVVFSWAWWASRRARRARSMDRKLLLVSPPALVWLALFLGLALTGSRAGLIAGTMATVVQGLLLAAHRGRWRLSAAGVLAAGVGLGLVAVVGLQQGLGRFLATSAYELTWNVRLEVYSRSLELWTRFPWIGSGLATFRDAFAALQPSDVTVSFWHAHNDYLELLDTAGVVGAVIVAVGVIALVARLLRVLNRAERSEDRGAALAALGAFTALAVHSCFDFGLSLPANSATFIVICGLAMGTPIGHAHDSSHRKHRRSHRQSHSATAGVPNEPAASPAPAHHSST